MLIYALWFASHDIERNMIWLTVWAFDFPISYLFVEPASTLLLAVECIVIGGVQWAMIGMGIDLFRRSLPKKRSLRGTQNI